MLRLIFSCFQNEVLPLDYTAEAVGGFKEGGIITARLSLTLKASITTAADDKFCDIFPNFRKKIRYYVS